jgi:DNA polymerase III alpha subunit
MTLEQGPGTGRAGTCVELYLKNDEEVRDIWDMALKLEGLTRNVGKHAGGVVIAPTKLTDFMFPLL